MLCADVYGVVCDSVPAQAAPLSIRIARNDILSVCGFHEVSPPGLVLGNQEFVPSQLQGCLT